jgi:hypothetical protein
MPAVPLENTREASCPAETPPMRMSMLCGTPVVFR